MRRTWNTCTVEIHAEPPALTRMGSTAERLATALKAASARRALSMTATSTSVLNPLNVDATLMTTNSISVCVAIFFLLPCQPRVLPGCADPCPFQVGTQYINEDCSKICTCEGPNEEMQCKAMKCTEHASCVLQEGQYMCMCNPPYMQEGTECVGQYISTQFSPQVWAP